MAGRDIPGGVRGDRQRKVQRRPSAGIGDLALEASRDFLGIQTQLLGITADEAEGIRGCRQSLEPAAFDRFEEWPPDAQALRHFSQIEARPEAAGAE